MAVSLGPSGLTLDNFSVPNDSPNAVLQVKQNRNFSVSTITNATANLTGGLSITPSSTSSKILLTATINLGIATSSPNWAAYFRRGSTDLGQFTDGSRNGGLVGGQTYISNIQNEHMESHSFSYLDSPSTTSATTYYVRMSVTDGGVRVNRVGANTDAAWAVRGYTTITAMEIAA